jgi:hypothetical protein
MKLIQRTSHRTNTDKATTKSAANRSVRSDREDSAHGRISMLSQKLRNAIYQFRGWERRRRICNAMLLDIALKFRKPFRWDRCRPRAHANIGNKLAPQVR